MAGKGSNKELSVRHEDFVAYLYEGKRSPSSGASVTDAGDVRGKTTLFECKVKRGEIGVVPRRYTLVKLMEKIADEAYAEDREPALALRFYSPESVLADQEGWVDLVVRTLADDASRDQLLLEYDLK